MHANFLFALISANSRFDCLGCGKLPRYELCLSNSEIAVSNLSFRRNLFENLALSLVLKKIPAE